MISYQQVLKEIERQVQRARQTNQESTIREALAAVRSLSEVALSGDGEPSEQVVMPKRVEMPQMTQPTPVQSLSSLESTPLEEADGANGKSLFDF